jgi:putative addiction module component (TIGR02574 family)
MDMLTALQAVRQWPALDQIEFVQQIWDNLAESGWKPELTEDQKSELDRRLAAYEANPDDVRSWEEIES